ncbi:hypothetical protein NGB36_16900 [Streptomyces sp. RB6PN25]|uniref:Uncharacterized protein n=1 Tax=Streptomyces humicola TaxID=2953240 RepID=A0ABT1PX67_9ACTN|nr:hypothetical protein [Streptomyces humicola]MCQ4082239.1 hypothetical protein [Streptomyces humicola]
MAFEAFGVLTPAQADGLACVVCDADFLRVAVAHVPVGRSDTGSQVFACKGACALRVAEEVERLVRELRAAASEDGGAG